MFRSWGSTLIFVLVCTAAQAVDFNPACYTGPKNSIFVSGLQRFVTLKDEDGDFTKTRYRPTAVAVGYQFASQNWSAGMSLSFESGLSKQFFDDGAIRLRDQTFGVSLFGTYTTPTGLYASSSFVAGFASERIKSGQIAGYDVSAGESEHSVRIGASIEFGKIFAVGNGYRVTPHVGFDYSYMPGGSLEFYLAGIRDDHQTISQNFYEVPMGVSVAKDFVACDWVITPSFDLTLVSRIGKLDASNINFRHGFAARTGSGWKVYGIGADHWGGRITAGIKAVKSERFDLGLEYTYEGRKDYNDHRITAGFGFSF